MSTGPGTPVDPPAPAAKRAYHLKATRQPRKLDRERAKALRAAGYTMPAIAKELGVSKSGVYKFLIKDAPAHRALEAFKANRANVFADLQRAAIDLQQQILASFVGEDGVLKPLTDGQKNGLLLSLNAVSGTIYDKERLESGKSTQNIGLIARMMGGSLDRVHKDASNSGEAEDETLTE